ncbi:hypothetical protein BU24DRAFT_449465 [Aaosphaeria arxii CBS 175.79]|uniref:DUF4419 domain-containing protein n=1 Tax=Aaosphaeria arxii CBS 175.79 TaxID=1450172 RepID=A0A6A5XY50_9PLEO|nr:uncharacterized protein BU24DRAFT_449465 [Aaosphaeria arxii CBS 175.79]KAF2017886.1 hypothetical protein BU24DRAFT_449465 [Aaosphaeria arxii CBS 175.79]
MATSSVTVFPSDAEPRAYNHEGYPHAVKTSSELFRNSCRDQFLAYPEAEVYFSSYDEQISQGDVYSSGDSFARGAIDAWAQHRHLIIRPDEVWFAILVQLNFYMIKNAERLRHLFVSHTGKKRIHVSDCTFEGILHKFQDAIHEEVKPGWLRNWVMPEFSTTTWTDHLTASVLLMGLMQRYFKYSCDIICGFPSVTLKGEKEDWEQLLAKIDRLATFGAQPEQFAEQLRPILERFVRTFEEPDHPETRTFWNSMVVAKNDGACGLPPYSLKGWLTGFFFWDLEGNPVIKREPENPLILNGIAYKKWFIEDLPVGYAQAPVVVIGFKGMEEFPAYVLAGNVGKRIKMGLPDGYEQALQRFDGRIGNPRKRIKGKLLSRCIEAAKRLNGQAIDDATPHGTLEPMSGWLMYGPAPDPDGGPSPGYWPEVETEFEDLYRSLGRSIRNGRSASSGVRH